MKQDDLEFKLTLDGEVLDSEVVFPVVGQASIEEGVVFRGGIVGLASLQLLFLVPIFDLLQMLLRTC
jgi:hypothetical protein